MDASISLTVGDDDVITIDVVAVLLGDTLATVRVHTSSLVITLKKEIETMTGVATSEQQLLLGSEPCCTDDFERVGFALGAVGGNDAPTVALVVSQSKVGNPFALPFHALDREHLPVTGASSALGRAFTYGGVELDWDPS
jgi:hypothetical protein